MKGSPDTPTIYLGVRRPNVALSEKVEHLLQYGGWMHSAPSMLPISWPITRDKMGMEHLASIPGYLVGASLWPTCPQRGRALPEKTGPTGMSW